MDYALPVLSEELSSRIGNSYCAEQITSIPNPGGPVRISAPSGIFPAASGRPGGSQRSICLVIGDHCRVFNRFGCPSGGLSDVGVDPQWPEARAHGANAAMAVVQKQGGVGNHHVSGYFPSP